MTHSCDGIRWTRMSGRFHGHWKVSSIEEVYWSKMIFEPISKCYHIIIHVGTGIPEPTIDQQTNQKVPKVPPTSDRHSSQDGK